ncbi:MAG TPA: hypothetical protein VH518_04565 [Tepidisphaeraceae bacterium]
MISVESAILKTRRDLALGTAVKVLLIAAGVVAIISPSILENAPMAASALMIAVVATWVVLSVRSIRGSRVAADSPSLIAAGRYELAEQHLAEAIGSFSIIRSAKLMCLHHLALSRHAQSRWQESATLCRALLTQGWSNASGFDRSSRLILSESLLELGDLAGVHDNLSRLYSQRLSLREALHLLVIQLDYLSRIGSWQQMLINLKTKIELAELLPQGSSARAQALLGLAAKKSGMADWSDWLRRRVELLADVQKLCTDRPILWELWRP